MGEVRHLPLYEGRTVELGEGVCVGGKRGDAGGPPRPPTPIKPPPTTPKKTPPGKPKTPPAKKKKKTPRGGEGERITYYPFLFFGGEKENRKCPSSFHFSVRILETEFSVRRQVYRKIGKKGKVREWCILLTICEEGTDRSRG